MPNANHVQLPPDIDFADPETDRRCFYCESVLLDDGDCAVCEPRCLMEASPLRLSVSLAPPLTDDEEDELSCIGQNLRFGCDDWYDRQRGLELLAKRRAAGNVTVLA